MRDGIGFIGLGRMGRAMASRIAAAGMPLTVHNRSREVAESFARDHAAGLAAHPRAVAEVCDVLITMVADDVALGAVMDGPDGILAGLRTGSLVIDMGTVGREMVLALAPRVAACGAELVDAPVSGMPAVAAAGRLLIMAGGRAAAIERARPVLSVLGERILHLGPTGTGAAMKLAINTAIHGLNQALSEALVLAERSGIERATAYEVFASGAISGPFVINRRSVFEHPGEGPQPFSIRLAAKDVRLALDLGRQVGAPMEQAALNLDLLERAGADGLQELDESAIALWLRDRAAASGGTA